MRTKAFLIILLSFLAALNGVGQEAYVVYEGAESSHFVDNHPGSSYSWSVLSDFTPDSAADKNAYTFTTTTNSQEVGVRWNRAGIYYLNVVETDIGGCTNRKVLAVNVVLNSRNVQFAEDQSEVCYDPDTFKLALQFLNSGGLSFDQEDFPVNVEFIVNDNLYNQQIAFNQEMLEIAGEWFTADPRQDTMVKVRLVSAKDSKGESISIGSVNDVHTRIIRSLPQLYFEMADLTVSKQSLGYYQVDVMNREEQKLIYQWSVEPPEGTSTDLSVLNGASAEIIWNGPIGTYAVNVSVIDENGCESDTVSKLVEVKPGSAPIPNIYAGPDTVIGSCRTYTFSKVYPVSDSYTYVWEPETGLSDPNVPNPVFTPGETTTYRLTATTSTGYSFSDSVTITVSEIFAKAGDDVVIPDGSTILLDGSGSEGQNINYHWTTENGKIEDGATTAFPVVSQPGTYYLQVSDKFGCTALDTVIVSRVIYAPIANTDFDTTDFQTTVAIDVLANDEFANSESDINSLEIIQYPLNGNASVNYADGTIVYTPDNNFVGSDLFEYRICNVDQLCDDSQVYVYISRDDFLIPEAFTPNGDNINDFFEIKGIQYYPGNSITIINRWGKKVYEAKNYGIDTNPIFWDGKSNVGGGNGDLPTGTYFYVIDLGNGDKKIGGSVYIDR